jgi:uncharacterized protein (TIGR03382 family)
MIKRWLPFALLCPLGLSTTSVHAFSDPEYFAQAVLAAGGGGRYFTGSPADGYTCKVCHAGGPETKLDVVGLPLAGYKPGLRYEVVVNWPGDVTKFALAMEFTDAHGKVAGAVRLPPQGELQPPEFCEPASDMVPAASIHETSDGRQLINLPDCGAKRVRLLWTAPAQDVGQLWFSGSAVTSDGAGDVYHDGVTDFGHELSSDAVVSMTTTSCSASAAHRHRHELGGAGALAVSLLALALVRRRRREAR